MCKVMKSTIKDTAAAGGAVYIMCDRSVSITLFA